MTRQTKAENKIVRRYRNWSRVLLGASLMPWVNLAAWAAYAFTMRFCLGHFPLVCLDDTPASVGAVFYPLVSASFWLLVASAVLWLMVTYFVNWPNLSQISRSRWRAKTVWVLGWGTTFLLCIADPVGFLRWFLD